MSLYEAFRFNKKNFSLNKLILNAHPVRFLCSHMQTKNLKPGKPLYFFCVCKSLCLATNCLYDICLVTKKGYYLLDKVVVPQKDHAGMGHLSRKKKSICFIYYLAR